MAKDAQGRIEKQAQGPSQNWLSDSRKKVQLYLSQGKKKKGDKVADDEGDYAMRTNEDRVTVHMCTEELFLST